jgi:hypothetical protein
MYTISYDGYISFTEGEEVVHLEEFFIPDKIYSVICCRELGGYELGKSIVMKSILCIP